MTEPYPQPIVDFLRGDPTRYPQGGAVFPVEAPATAPAEVGS